MIGPTLKPLNQREVQEEVGLGKEMEALAEESLVKAWDWLVTEEERVWGEGMVEQGQSPSE